MTNRLKTPLTVNYCEEAGFAVISDSEMNVVVQTYERCFTTRSVLMGSLNALVACANACEGTVPSAKVIVSMQRVIFAARYYQAVSCPKLTDRPNAIRAEASIELNKTIAALVGILPVLEDIQ